MAAELGKLSDSEQKLFKSVVSGDVGEVKALLRQDDVKVNCLDESGMTPLMQAAYRGDDTMSRLLLAHGADVNSNHHQHGYTALMFAALSGKTDVTQTMLEAGANVTAENSVNRNAAQMAAFVGQHQVVSVINNFFSRADLEYFCQKQGLEKEAKLPPHLCSSLYKLIACHNVNPIKISMELQSMPELYDEAKKVQKVLDILTEKMMKQKETNEIMALKFHYLYSLFKETVKWKSEKNDNLDGWIKRLCRGRDSDGCREVSEQFVRSMLKSFPYVESQLLQQTVRTLARVQIGDVPSAVSVLNSGINGQRFASEEDKLCTLCGDFKAEKKCSACKYVNYCDGKCQKLDWSTHKKFCKEMNESRIQHEKQRELEETADKQRQEKKEIEKQENKSNDSDSQIVCEDTESVAKPED